MRQRRLVAPILLSVVILVAALGAAWAASRGAEQRGPLASALDALPTSTVTVDYTDWTDIDDSLDAAALDGLSIRSVLAPLDAEMRELLGWSVRDLGWEAFGVTDEGAVTVIGLGDVTTARAERSFARLGTSVGDGRHEYRLPDDTSGGSSDFRSTFGWVGVVPDRDLVLAAPDEASLDAAMRVVSGRDRSLLGVRAVANLATSLGGATSALVQERQPLCASSALDPSDTAARSQLSATLGASAGLADPVWGGRALFDGSPQRIVFSSVFGSEAVAREQDRVRHQLATGPFIGRSGRVADSLVDLRSTISGAVVSLDFALTPGGEEFMTDTGPVVFAGCAPRP